MEEPLLNNILEKIEVMQIQFSNIDLQENYQQKFSSVIFRG